MKQTVDLFGLENCSQRVKEAYKAGGNRLMEPVPITQLIEPNDERDGQLAAAFAYREYFWEGSSAAIGAVKVKCESTATFTAGTTLFSAANITDTYYNLFTIPSAPLTA